MAVLGQLNIIDKVFVALLLAYFRQKLKFGLLIKKTVITDLMNQVDYVYICPGESVIFKCNLREFHMIYAFCSARKDMTKPLFIL